MDAKELHHGSSQRLLEEIVTDPAMINRAAADPAAAVVTPVVPVIPVVAVGRQGLLSESSGAGNAAPKLNLLAPRDLADPLVEVADPTPVGPPDGPVTRGGKRAKLVASLVVLALLIVAGGAFAWYRLAGPGAAQPLAVASPTPTVVITPSPSPTPSPTPTATPTPSPTPTQTTVTAPAAAPTAAHPQAVTVKSKSGLWLRSSPDSSNQSNVIGWIPYNGQVSVDATGSFWWHGTYAGKTGYFAVNYTN